MTLVEGWFLRYEGEFLAVGFDVEGGNVGAVVGDATGLRVVESFQVLFSD